MIRTLVVKGLNERVLLQVRFRSDQIRSERIKQREGILNLQIIY